MGQLKNRLILIAMMLALPLAGLVFFGLLTEHNFNTLPYFTEEGEMEGRTLAAQRVGAFELTNQNGELVLFRVAQGQGVDCRVLWDRRTSCGASHQAIALAQLQVQGRRRHFGGVLHVESRARHPRSVERLRPAQHPLQRVRREMAVPDG